MKNFVKILLLTSCGALAASCSSSKVSAVGEIEQLSNQGQCEEAEKLTSNKFRKSEYYLIMGIIADECRRDKNAAIRYMTIAARDGVEPAITWLISNDITPPQIQRAPEPTPPEPTPPGPQMSHTTVIMQQPRQKPMRQSLDGCIQDGGSNFCYNRQSQRYSNGGIINMGSPYGGSY